MASLKKQQKQRNKEVKAEEAVLDDLFYDMYRNRGRIYRVNFIRGLFFGFGSILGGTLVIAILVFGLSFLVQIPGGLGDFVKWIIDAIQNR
ncbi:MAG: DUF5665 domain-containing protein [Candidatus Saccharimonadales bacterium]